MINFIRRVMMMRADESSNSQTESDAKIFLNLISPEGSGKGRGRVANRESSRFYYIFSRPQRDGPARCFIFLRFTQKSPAPLIINFFLAIFIIYIYFIQLSYFYKIYIILCNINFNNPTNNIFDYNG